MAIDKLNSRYVRKYIDEKYKKYCSRILSSELHKDYSGIRFATFYDKLRFILLCEDDRYEDSLEEVRMRANGVLNELEPNELDLLFSKCISKINEEDIYDLYKEEPNKINLKYRYIADEFVELINEIMMEGLRDYAQANIESYLEELKDEIKDFAYNGSMESEDYNISGYWEEFCFQTQYGDGSILGILVDDIHDYLHSKLRKGPMKEVIILYTVTDDFYFQNSYSKIFPDKEHMVDWIIPVLIEEIQRVASKEYVPDFSVGEDWGE